MLSFGLVAVAQAGEPAPAPTRAPAPASARAPGAPAPQKDEQKTDKAPEKKDDVKGGAPAGGEKK